MKNISLPVFYFLFLLNSSLFAQEDTTNNIGFSQNSAINLSAAASTNVQAHGRSGYFYNPKTIVEGSEYLFDVWENLAFVFTKDNYKYSLKNINLNIKTNSFVSKISKDSIFTFNMNNVEKIVINNKVYKNVFSQDGKKICEVLYDSDNFSILKSFSLQRVEASPNPMVNQKNDRIIRKKTFYLLKDDSFRKFRLRKRKVLKLIDESLLDEVKSYVKKNKLSFRKEIDLKQILNYYNGLL